MQSSRCETAFGDKNSLKFVSLSKIKINPGIIFLSDKHCRVISEIRRQRPIQATCKATELANSSAKVLNIVYTKPFFSYA
ncbi:hypothetical protein TUM17576_13930 [Enterobacter hormaechei]|nr:hypothetical protein TUM17576_13930 [Enterobacter hormaechei]